MAAFTRMGIADSSLTCWVNGLKKKRVYGDALSAKTSIYRFGVIFQSSPLLSSVTT